MKRIFIKVEEWLAMALFALVATLVFVGAVTRLIGQPIIWSIDVAQMAFVWSSVLGADIAMRNDGHIKIDVLTRKLPRALSRPLARLWQIVIAAFLAYLVFYGTRLTLLNLERVLGDSGISYGWVTGAIPVGSALMLWTNLSRLWRDLTNKEPLFLAGHDGTVI